MTIFPAGQVVVDFVADIRAAVGRVVILERLEQPEAGNVAALVVFLEQQVHQHVRVRPDP